MWIYKITNIQNNKVYIGQSNNILRRWRDHKTNAFNSNDHNYNTHLYRSIRKYGLQNFSFEVLEECSISELDAREIYWISYYNSFKDKKHYNLTEGGEGMCGYSPTTKTKQKNIRKLKRYSYLNKKLYLYKQYC